MASTELDTSLVDARGDSIPAVSMPGGTKLPGSAIVFRDDGGTDHPVSETDPLPVAGEVSIDADQHTALLGQIAAVTTAVDALSAALALAVSAGLIELDSDEYATLAAAPGAPFADLLGFATAVDAWVAALDRAPYAAVDFDAALPLATNADVAHMTLTGDVTSFVNPTGTKRPGVQTFLFVQDGDGGHAIGAGAETAGSATVVWADGSAPDLTTDDPLNSTGIRFTQIGASKWVAEVLYRNEAP